MSDWEPSRAPSLEQHRNEVELNSEVAEQADLEPAPESSRLALSHLYEAYGRAVYVRCRGILGDSASAEDATHDVFLKVMTSLDSVPRVGSPLPWLKRIAVNHCINLLRSARFEPVPVSKLPEHPGLHPVESFEARDWANAVLSSSPRHQRVAGLMFHAEGVDQREIAQRLGVSLRTVVYRVAAFGNHVARWESGGSASTPDLN